MSTRALRKLQVQSDHELGDDAIEIQNDCSDALSPKNRFAFLESNEDVEENEDENAKEVLSEKTAKKRQKKKKTKKASMESKKVDAKHSDQDTDWAALLEKINENSPPPVEDTKDLVLTESDLFKIEYRNLNVENELKRLFGKAVGSLISEDVDDNRRTMRIFDQKNVRQRRPGTSAGRIVQPKNLANHHIAKTGLSMVLEKRAPCDVNQFKFEHNAAYQEVQFLFWDAVDKMNPELFVAILKDHPFHVDTLIQMSEIYRVNEDFGTARDLLERAIATCESAFHPMFNVALCKSRLDYKQQENRPFFLALLKHMQYTCQRVCFRTALELCKLIFSLDPESDPLGMLLHLDYLCLRSKQYDFLVNVYHVLEGRRNLSQLPNFAYSLALALFLKSSGKKLSAEEAEQLAIESDEKLKIALIKFPTMLPILLDKCGVEPDKSVSQCEAFSLNESLKDGQGLKALMHLYAGRCCSLWKDANVVAWLERNVKKLLDDKSLHENNCEYVEYRTNRRTRYQTTPLNVCRHVVLSPDEEALGAKAYLPPEIRQQSIHNHNPLPPEDGRCSYERPVPVGQAAPVGGSLLGSFLRSLMPNYNPAIEAERQAEGAADGAVAPLDFHQSVRNVLRAVRELLAEVQPEPAPREDNNEEEGGLGDDPNDWVDEFD